MIKDSKRTCVFFMRILEKDKDRNEKKYQQKVEKQTGVRQTADRDF